MALHLGGPRQMERSVTLAEDVATDSLPQSLIDRHSDSRTGTRSGAGARPGGPLTEVGLQDSAPYRSAS